MTCNNLCVIPARGGSKRIPRKNIRDFCGKPIIAWSIEAALESRLFEHVIVSTDDEEIASISRSYGAETPFMRSAALADDYTGTDAVVRDAVQWVVEHLTPPDYVCTIYPTAPFVTAARLIDGYELLRSSSASRLMVAARFTSPIQRALKVDPDGRVAMFQPEHFMTRSQDLEPAYHDAGQFYWASSSVVLDEAVGFKSNGIMMVLPRHLVQDIDTEDDWNHAELIFKVLMKR